MSVNILERVSEASPVGQNGLPEGWGLVTLPDVCDINPPKPSPDALAPEAPVTFVPMPAVDAEQGAITKPETRPFGKVRKGYTSFREGDVIMAKITPCMENGKAAIARNLQNGLGFGSTEFHVFRSKGAILADFLYHFIRQESFRKAAEHEMTGSVGQKRVPPSFLENVEIPMPPLAEQKRIVAKIEELLARVNATRARLAKVPAILKCFRQAVLAAACSGRLTEDWRSEHAAESRSLKSNGSTFRESPGTPDGWGCLTIDKLSSSLPRSIQSGPFGSNLHHSEFQATGVLAIGIDNVMAGKFTLGKEHRISERKYRELEKYRARPLDVLITVMATVGRCCVVPEDVETAIITKHVYRITPNRKIVNPHYLMYSLLGDPTVQSQIQSQIRGQTRPGINGKILKAISIAIPPLPEQDEIVQRIDTLLELAEKIDGRVAAASQKAERTALAILAKGFRGELVPTEAELARVKDRFYEPSDAVMRRIKAARKLEIG